MKEIDNKRLVEVFSYLKEIGSVYNQADFTRKLDDNKSYISELFRNKREYGEQFVRRLCEVFTQINPDYLLLKESEMLIDEINIPTSALDSQVIPISELLSRLDKKDAQMDLLIETIRSQQSTITKLTDSRGNAQVEGVGCADVG